MVGVKKMTGVKIKAVVAVVAAEKKTVLLPWQQ